MRGLMQIKSRRDLQRRDEGKGDSRSAELVKMPVVTSPSSFVLPSAIMNVVAHSFSEPMPSLMASPSSTQSLAP